MTQHPLSDAPAVVTVATGEHYCRGQARLVDRMNALDQFVLKFTDALPPGSPSHAERPYAYKAYALHWAAVRGWKQLLWADACIVPTQKLDRIWQHAEQHGVWISRNGYQNYEWTAEAAYEHLFPGSTLEEARAINQHIPHVVAGAFAVDLNHEKGRSFLRWYYELALTPAFCGSWINDYRLPQRPWRGERTGYCGPADVRGHRHDQTAASVICWRLGIPLTNPPDFFSYPPGDERTILIADGAY